MKIEHLVAQITANAPECPAYKINGYLLELLEKLRLEGSREIITLDTSTCDPPRRDIRIPHNVMQVHNVWLNGREIRQSLREHDIVYVGVSASASSLLWADPYDDKFLTDQDGKALEII